MSPRCSVCDHETVPLFTSTVCDWCDGTGDYSLDRGFVVWPGSEHRSRGLYVFRREQDARVWRDANSVHRWPIVEVLCEVPFAWRTSTGRLQGIETADRLYEVHPDRFFRRAPHRAFLADRAPLSAAS